METLPVEMLEKIVCQLTPQELARCSTVCREWHEIFNQDWIWKPHCDLELEEPLQTIPSIATPEFVIPKVENSTFSPICYWKLAFMRECHLWKNWGKHDKKEIYRIENEGLVFVDFFTDTLIAVWYESYLEILDVSVKPPVSRAKSDTPVSINPNHHTCHAIGTTLLTIEKECSVEVYNVDMTNGLIKLKNCILLKAANRFPPKKIIVKDHNCLFTTEQRLVLKIFDLSTGEILKEEPFPLKENEDEYVEFSEAIGSSTSDFIAVGFIVVQSPNCFYKLYVYNIKQLAFLPDVAIDVSQLHSCQVTLHHHWLVHKDTWTLSVHDIKSKEVLLHQKGNYDYSDVIVYDNRFLFTLISPKKQNKWLQSYYPASKTLTTICNNPDTIVHQIMLNNYFSENYKDHRKICLWRFTNQMKFDILSFTSLKINSSCTKMVVVDDSDVPGPQTCVRYLW